MLSVEVKIETKIGFPINKSLTRFLWRNSSFGGDTKGREKGVSVVLRIFGAFHYDKIYLIVWAVRLISFSNVAWVHKIEVRARLEIVLVIDSSLVVITRLRIVLTIDFSLLSKI